MSVTDEEVQELFDHFHLISSVEDTIDRVKHGIPLSQDTREELFAAGIDLGDMEEEFEDG